ncbi:ABC transporter ATP-binding protein [Aureimonas leprariae]|uniref:ABC transporter ATP-binding protein n=1 Tax=Plantimonas leprariae TaxID=2615207 RepID=A0A7V7TVC6_9HYPH|nr:ABC transporter ATP-binding protein [Aureimonas leprariae]KAB0677558.1 ABC transporter ATP-binding protein [Aureimonas leprariae]
MGEPSLSLGGAGHSYDGRAWQFRKLDLVVGNGDVIAVLGPNGRGKSTLLRVMAGLLRASEGTVEAAGPVGFVPQDFAGAFPYSALDIVLMGRARHVATLRMPTAKDEAIALDALHAVGMVDLAARSFDRLSGGERQLVLIARALASEASILLLDEPASALDLQNQGRVLDLIGRLAAQGRTLVFTTHQPNHAITAASKALLMMEEESPIFGAVDGVVTERNLEALYGLPVRLVPFEVDGTLSTSAVPVFGGRGLGRHAEKPTGR